MRENNLNYENLLNTARELECRVIYDEPLSAHCSFKIGGNCYAMIDVSTEESLAVLVKEANNLGVRTLTLGKGSNVLFDDRGFDGIVFLMGNSFEAIELVDENTAGVGLAYVCSELTAGLTHQTGLESDLIVAHFPLDFCLWREGCN